MKTETEMLAKALEIVNTNENAFVGFFYPTELKAKWGAMTLRDKLLAKQHGTVFMHSMSYVAPTGSKLLIRFIDEDNHLNFGGFQFSHVFVLDVDAACSTYLRSRTRSAYKFNSPIGVYDQHGLDAQPYDKYVRWETVDKQHKQA